MLREEGREDPLESVLKSLEEFEAQFSGGKKRDQKKGASEMGSLVQELVKEDALEILSLLKQLAASKDSILAHHILSHIFANFSVGSFIEMC